MGVCKGECIFGIKKFKREVLTRESRNTNVFFFFFVVITDFMILYPLQNFTPTYIQ